MSNDSNNLTRGRVLVSWRLLRSIGNSRAAKLTLLIPLVGYLILLNDNIVRHLDLSSEVFGAAAGTTLTKLLAIYCGLVFVAIASVIFAACCPLEVKRYASSVEYVAGDEPFMSDRTIGMLEHRLTIGDDIARKDSRDYYDVYHQIVPGDLAELRRRGRDVFRIRMDVYYEMLDRSRPIARWATAIFYTVGLAFLLVPSAVVFWRVMCVLGEKAGIGS